MIVFDLRYFKFGYVQLQTVESLLLSRNLLHIETHSIKMSSTNDDLIFLSGLSISSYRYIFSPLLPLDGRRQALHANFRMQSNLLLDGLFEKCEK